MNTDVFLPYAAPELLEHPRPRRWTRDEYHQAAALGLFGPEERLELIDGEVIAKMSPQGTPHTVSVRAVTEALQSAFGPSFDVRYQLPLTLDDRSEPEPDVLVVPGTWRDYQERHPGPADVRLLVEVSDTTLVYDRTRKARLYAAAGIADYWIVNLGARCLEVHRDPLPDAGYQTVSVHAESRSVSPLAAPQSPVRVVGLLPLRP